MHPDKVNPKIQTLNKWIYLFIANRLVNLCDDDDDGGYDHDHFDDEIELENTINTNANPA